MLFTLLASKLGMLLFEKYFAFFGFYGEISLQPIYSVILSFSYGVMHL